MQITEEVIKDFRRFLPAFSDTTKWGADAIMMQLIEADAMTGGSVWGAYDMDDDRNFKKRGMYYLSAHYLVSIWGDSGTADPSKIKPDARLNVASKQVGDMAVTYRVTEMEATVDDFLSTTLYGTKFRELRQLASCNIVAV